MAGLNAARAAAGRRAGQLRPRRGLYRRDDRRPRHPRRHRALSDVHQPRGVPPAPARRQRRPAADRARGSRWASSAPSARAGVSTRRRRRWPRPATRRASLTLTPAEAAQRRLPRQRRRPAAQPRPAAGLSATSASTTWRGSGRRSATGRRRSREQIEIDAAYAGYLDRQDADVEAFRRDEAADACRPTLDYAARRRPFQRGAREAGRRAPRDARPGRPHRRRHPRRAHRPAGPCPPPPRSLSAAAVTDAASFAARDAAPRRADRRPRAASACCWRTGTSG